MSSTNGKNDVVSAPEADIEMTEAELAIHTAAFAAGRAAGFAAGRNIGYKRGIDTCRALLARIPSVPPALPEDQEKDAAVPLSTSIDELGLTGRSTNVLKREGIHTISDIFRLDEEDLSEIRNLGSKGIDEIIAKLAEFGYTYRAS